VKQCGRQASKTKTLRLKMFLKWRHSAPIFHYTVNFMGVAEAGNFMPKKHWNLVVLV